MHRSTWRHSCSRCDTLIFSVVHNKIQFDVFLCEFVLLVTEIHGVQEHATHVERLGIHTIEQYPSHTLEFPFLRTTHSLKQLRWVPAALQSNCSPSLLASSKSCRIEENAKKQKMNFRGNQKYLRIFFLIYLFIHFLLFLSLSSTMSQQNSAEQYLTAFSLYL